MALWAPLKPEWDLLDAEWSKLDTCRKEIEQEWLDLITLLETSQITADRFVADRRHLVEKGADLDRKLEQYQTRSYEVECTFERCARHAGPHVGIGR